MALTSYRTPGVYVEWLDVNPQHIEVGRTDVAGFVGLAERGPVQQAVKIESSRQFLTTLAIDYHTDIWPTPSPAFSRTAAGSVGSCASPILTRRGRHKCGCG